MADPPSPDPQPAAAVGLADDVVRRATEALARAGGVDAGQVVAYDLAHAAAAVGAARAMLEFGANGALERRLACGFVADMLADLSSRTVGREEHWGVTGDWLTPASAFVRSYRDPAFLAPLATTPGPRHLGEDYELVGATFHRFAEERIRPHAERVHRTNADVPEEIIQGLAGLGGFGLSVPEEYGGGATGGEGDYLGMVVATEELSWGSLGIGGSLVTRPEILTRALVNGGTEAQKRHWLPRLASGEVLVAVAVTEPDFGSDVAGITTAARPTAGGWLVSGVKTWCTFAARAGALMLLARTDPDRSRAHRGLSMFIVEKERGDGHGFVFTGDPAAEGRSDPPGRMEGRPIDTLGYRGMHSYELALENWFVPDANLIGGSEGLGKGFYLQMQGFENGRLQTAARAVGVMQAAYEAACAYAADRIVFGSPIAAYQLTQVKLARMAIVTQATRQFALSVARSMGRGGGSLEASMVKAYACRAAEWVTREAMQIHGGLGYAEEVPVSRYFADARVLPIFEGADETLALKVIARRLLERATG
ncbi:MAG TPA: acyl-CoA dehydrogenase family protein [Acidimicrobiales bacterium]|nr:acyl-CoA dehydrogenase family protein [Acidimicrobiales bacterium]